MTTLEDMTLEEFAQLCLIEEDLPIMVGCENMTIDSDFGDQFPELTGLLGHFSVNGLEVLGFLAGGDWEHPVYLVVWESKNGQLKIGCPDAGNMYNRETNAAYGNNDDCYDAADEIGRDGLPEFEPGKLRKELEKMIK